MTHSKVTDSSKSKETDASAAHRDAGEDHDEGNDHDQNRTVVIVVNGRSRKFSGKAITFLEVVDLAFENPPYGANTMFTVTYKRGHREEPEGSMVEGGKSVKVKEGMVFNVTATDKS